MAEGRDGAKVAGRCEVAEGRDGRECFLPDEVECDCACVPESMQTPVRKRNGACLLACA